MKRILFLDLEQTLIADFDTGRSAVPIHHNTVRSFINQYAWSDIFIYSYAIWNSKDVLSFNTFIRPWVEQHYGIKISDTVWTISEIKRVIAKASKISLMDNDDFFTFFDKERSFKVFVEAKFKDEKDTEFWLLDDMVQNSKTITENTILRTINCKNPKVLLKDSEDLIC